LIVDIDDMLRSVEKFVTDGRLNKVERGADGNVRTSRRRVLVVDDSLTVRELERKLLGQAGYDVEIAVDGVDGWNAVRASDFDLIVTDIDMPRMDGIELVRMIKQDPKLGKLPVMIVSYKDREEDRRRGLEAGADYYLTKGSFHDDTLQQAVADLIGAAA
jgi:two-component system sensor histidine kinase and response regulator WspE